ncbi:HD domain-containing protein [Paenibacillus filicis]|uniref:HD domain-containing protein n=1 Tax=Paenibacillus gyeongsangnamensis TaxID=3388067 RepID=A0ABT4QJZ4_9BACL|nr:HD domain-containing protein [Paenibacillus filicis]MCZ8517197.1 HD domain-containing protein [Paenibacillus filicis]
MKRLFPFVRMALPEWFEPAVEKVWLKMNDDATGHDFLHAVRVMELAVDIASQLGADRDIAMTAGLLHDYYRKEEKQTGRLHYGLEAIDGLRREFGPLLLPHLEEVRFERVMDVIARHEEYDFSRGESGGIQLSLDHQIVQDADRIDAIGAVGIARTFMFGGVHGLPLVEDGSLPDAVFDPTLRPQGSVYRHFYEKLLHLSNGMHTIIGKRIASERHQFLVCYIKQLKHELMLEPGDLDKYN